MTITGDRLLGGGASIDRAWLAGVEATIVDAAEYQNTYDAGTELRLVARNSSARAGDIVLLADTGAVVTKNAGWVYQTPGLVTDVSPSYGQYNTEVTITGTRLLADGDSFASITLAGTAIQTLVNFSNTTINVVVDHADAGQGDVALVVNTGDIVTLEDG